MVLPQKFFSATNLKSRDLKDTQASTISRIIHLSYPHTCYTIRIIIISASQFYASMYTNSPL